MVKFYERFDDGTEVYGDIAVYRPSLRGRPITIRVEDSGSIKLGGVKSNLHPDWKKLGGGGIKLAPHNKIWRGG